MLTLPKISKLRVACKKRPNILIPDTPGIDDGDKQLFVAPKVICDWTQNMINQIAEHSHLKEAIVAVLIKVDPGDAKKLNKGEVVSVGKAKMAGEWVKLLTAVDKKVAAVNFVITLSGEWLRMIGLMDNDFKVCAEDIATISQAMSLLDHELLHCGAKIAGQFISKKNMPDFIKGLGGRHIETCDDIECPDSGDKLVRYYEIKDKKFIWKMRKHDIQEFNGIVSRWGKCNRQIGRLVDVIKESQPSLFEKAVA